jgi:hypothetical protein
VLTGRGYLANSNVSAVRSQTGPKSHFGPVLNVWTVHGKGCNYPNAADLGAKGNTMGRSDLTRRVLSPALALCLTVGSTVSIWTHSSLAATSSVLYACVNKSTGAVRIVSQSTKCAATEYATHWNVTGATGPAGPQGPPGAGARLVTDSNSKIVGTFLPDVSGSAGTNSDVVLQINSIWFQLPVSTTGFASNGTGLYYSRSGCSGTAYIASRAGPGQPMTGLVTQADIVNETLYYATSWQSCSQLAFASWQQIFADGTFGTCNVFSQSACSENPAFAPPSTFDLSTLGFFPPFSLH